MKNIGEGDRTLYCFFIVFSKIMLSLCLIINRYNGICIV
ncbi:hypothetical protein SA3033_08570 [Aggregatibacter actinomycetemcomitans serotype d str. SA3033]|nr:hypothetical protein SA2876_02865 [Aggregatibacter actinomycetemcomitans serotype e str. SA2876]KYK83185.1 hypothetical protein SA3033_08570 [Aggregatibacter actinomycetemcomitans serotype d str. SA3033]KYK88530.1 hypothetical protein SC29R_02780 [Aggregatibacter actinomycetemcomitans serotype f str. SC29R]KYK90007.1 hypothetical protein SA2200_01345 [Aggregatibacter actinomycetemcomitans serotype d str. SA2200]KYK91385.1 hypothetical protein SA508_00440 [Aggregatibacter actinomycetemcomitan